MKTSLLIILTLLVCSCFQQKKPGSDASTDSIPGQDSTVYQELISSFDTQFSKIENEYESANEPRRQELDHVYEKVELALVEAQKKFIREHPSSPLCISILWEIDWSFQTASEFSSYLNLIDNSFHQQEDYLKLESIVQQMEKVEVGNIAPDFEMNNAGGNPLRLSSIYADSEYLLLDFWASTCGPCRKENANIVKAYEIFHGKGFDVLGVSTDERREHWLDAIEKDGLIWNNVCALQKWGENEIVKTYALRQVSQNFLLDNTGKIIAVDIRGDDMITILEQLLP